MKLSAEFTKDKKEKQQARYTLPFLLRVKDIEKETKEY
jgi:hypothetical protein